MSQLKHVYLLCINWHFEITSLITDQKQLSRLYQVAVQISFTTAHRKNSIGNVTLNIIVLNVNTESE